MSLEKKDFYGKEVAVAIKNACNALGVAQEKLEIEVIETGSTGIFGLIRKKAHIRVLVKPEVEEVATDVFEVDSYIKSEPKQERKPEPAKPETVEPEAIKTEAVSPIKDKVVEPVQKVVDKKDDNGANKDKEPEAEVSPESVEIVKTELLQLVELMGFPSTLEVETAGLSVACTLRGEFEENLTGVDGKVLDSLQYILRKVISRKVPERLRISINIGEFRERRLF
jgi:spoIIIJ-associated protein